MNMTDLPRDPRIDIKKYNISSDPFGEVDEFYRVEVDPLIDSLVDDSLRNSIKQSIQKYFVVIIWCFGLFLSKCDEEFDR
jgi:hypothetical protein